jgi:F-type H+-transporting ATPase subunit delta
MEAITDVGAQGVARVYAEALYRAAEKKDQVDVVLGELEGLIQQSFATSPEIEAFLASGIIGRGRKAEVFRSTFEGRVSETFFHFLMVLNDHERLALLRSIHAAYQVIRDERARRILVRVRTAVPLADDQRSRLAQQVREALHLEPAVEEQVEPDLLGGMIVRVADWVFDGSVRTRLARIQDEIIARSTHEIQSGRDRFSSAV